ncbi:hypothetical protein GE061_003370 [Apolygus lucorum]|uniref:C2H2-type domain-containing protein n=1 Tax=Apolygus lucorum TaxID=248454 RepID=A0A6A4JF90_APOLU|nr:hypothetical protein GE061_003370 [Apolygus lucorum]
MLHVCVGCGRTYAHKRSLYRHVKFECGFTCEDCGKSYKYKAGWYQHRKYQCAKDPSFFCQFCPYKAKLKTIAKLTCPKCGKVFRHYQNLWTHRKYVCGKEAQFACKLCSYKAKLKVCLKQHYVNKHRDVIMTKPRVDALSRLLADESQQNFIQSGKIQNHQKFFDPSTNDLNSS